MSTIQAPNHNCPKTNHWAATFIISLICAGNLLAQNHLAVSSGSTSGTIYHTGGNLGLGLQTAQSKLHIYEADDNVLWPLWVNNGQNSSTVTGYGVGIRLKHSHNGETSKWSGIASIQESSWANQSGLALYADANERVRISGVGNVGIGTSSPAVRLQIELPTGAQFDNGIHINSGSGYLRFRNGTSAGSLFAPSILARSTVNWASYGLNVTATPNSDVSGYYGILMRAGETATLQNADVLRIQNYTTNLFTIQASGDIGMGTTAPTAPLEVNEGTMGWLVNVKGNSYNTNDFVGVKLSSGYGGEYSKWSGIAAVSENLHSNSTGLALYSGQSERIRITAGGNVGIGTTSPDEKLTVKGNIHAEEVRVDLSVPGPDYVFEPDYDLPSLDEISAYIKAHKHLPEIPSAAEMEANGVELGVMNMLLLKKIEELTLHLIEMATTKEELNKRLSRSEQLITELQWEIDKK